MCTHLGTVLGTRPTTAQEDIPHFTALRRTPGVFPGSLSQKEATCPGGYVGTLAAGGSIVNVGDWRRRIRNF